MTSPQKVVLAYSGGLDTSVIIPWLKEHYGSKVSAVIGDVGPPEASPGGWRHALARGPDQVAVARAEGADAVARGCTGKGNDQVRFELAYKALAPHLQIIAPWREWTLHSRDDEI